MKTLTAKMGITEEELGKVTDTLAEHPEIEKVSLFGSRAKGNYKPASDFDIAVSGKKLTCNTINELSYQLNDESVPSYYFDIINLNKISSEQLLTDVTKLKPAFVSGFKCLFLSFDIKFHFQPKCG